MYVCMYVCMSVVRNQINPSYIKESKLWGLLKEESVVVGMLMYVSMHVLDLCTYILLSLQ